MNDGSSHSESASIVRQWDRLSLMRRSEDVKGLLNELENPAENHEEVMGKTVILTIREQAIQELAKVGDQRAVQPIAKMLNDSLPQVRTHAAKALGRLGDRSAVPALIESLADDDFAVRAWSAESLGQLGDCAAVPALISMLKDEDFYVRLDAARALAQLGDPDGIDPLKEAVRRESIRHPTYRLRMAKALRALRLRAKGSPA